MKNRILFGPLFLFFWPLLLAQQTPAHEPRPPVVMGSAPADPAPLTDNQRIYRPTAGNDLLVSPDVLNSVVAKFRTAYGSPDAPRIVIYVNRDLVDTTSGMKLTAHTENYETADNSSKTSGQNTYTAAAGASPTLADKQTVREIERLFGRVFRNGGARLADQKTAVDLLADKPGHRLVGEQAAKEREALTSVADIAVEVLISSRNLTVPGISGDQVLTVPDIQATAIRLKDAAIVGQASASDVLGRDAQAGHIAQTFDVRDITEATAIALMQDMLTGAK
jgi:hypothetical protein